MPTQPHSLRDFALLADGERGAMLAPGGDIAWLCAPRWESPAVFAGLLGGGGGYSVQPTGVAVWGGSYDPGTLIFRSRWTGRTDSLEVREALALPSNRDSLTLLRRVEAVEGEVEVEQAAEVPQHRRLRPLLVEHRVRQER